MPSAKDPSTTEVETLSGLANQLQERVKELDCLFGISDIVERAGGSLDLILQDTVELLPKSWSHTDVASARIVLGDRDFRSDSFAESRWVQASDVIVHGERTGVIEIVYSESRSEQDEGPFTREERRLLNAVAQRIGHIVERLTADERLREREEEFRERITHFTRISTMGEMASSIAHEVNQPLTAVATYAQACRRMVKGGLVDAHEIMDILQRIGDEAIRAGDIIHRLRGMIKRRDSELTTCDLNRLLEEISPLASVDARLNEVELEITFPAGPLRIHADGVQIQQVVLNLIRNGIDAMAETPSDRRILAVRVTRLEEAEVQVSVTDQGCGLPNTDERDLFEPFFTTKEAGLGLGLSISRSIIAAHGGELSFSRNPDGGTTFFFTLPAAHEAEDE